ncbi:MAG TPA: hypothetical protein VFT04_13965 [Gemmatimonadales bacterium]|nr:hypothetical protein [Gemmatimonadales bacterium]
MKRRADAVRDYLQLRGAAAHVVAGGLEGLLEAWDRLVGEVDRGYRFTLDDYLNDLDVRELLAGAIERAGEPDAERARARLEAADERLRHLVVPTGECLWGAAVAEDEGWSPEMHWWYFSRPRRPGRALAADLGLDER